METAQWPLQEGESRVRPHKEKALICPRCNSTNTKFCYYNNYSFSQPRYFCKSCRRYWTLGGSLRNVPIGGGSRKKKRSYNSPSSSSLPSSTITTISSTSSTPSLKLSSSSRNMHPSKLSSFVSLSSSIAAFEPIRSGISSTNLISSYPSQSVYWQEIHGVSIEDLMWSSMVKFPLERNEIAVPYEDLKKVANKNFCEGGEDPTFFWEEVMGNVEGRRGW